MCSCKKLHKVHINSIPVLSTISLNRYQYEALDTLVQRGMYRKRAYAIREAIDEFLARRIELTKYIDHIMEESQ